jgi:hypothetical protein
MKILILHGLLTALSIIPAYVQSVADKSGAKKSGANSGLGIRTRRIRTSLPSSAAKDSLDLAGAVRTMQRAGTTER